MSSLSERRRGLGLSVIAPNRSTPSPLLSLSSLSSNNIGTPFGRKYSGLKSPNGSNGRETPLLSFMNEIPENRIVIRPIVRKAIKTQLDKNNIIQFIAKKNIHKNENFSVELYNEFKNDILNANNIIIVYDLSNPEEENIPQIMSRFAKLYLIKINNDYKYIVKKILKADNPETEQINVEVEVDNIKFINQNITTLPFMLESVVLRNNYENNSDNNVYIITKYLQNYISLHKYLENIKENIKEEIQIDIFKHILSQLNGYFKSMNIVGILHNDLDQHLNNIMINPKTFDIKIIDYGLCLLKSNVSIEYFNEKLVHHKNMLLLLILNKLFKFSNSRNLSFYSINIKTTLNKFFSKELPNELYDLYYL